MVRHKLIGSDELVNPRWLRIPAAVEYSGINRSRLFRLLAEGAVKSACLKEHQHAKRGLRLIDRHSLDLYLETLAKPAEELLLQQINELRTQEENLTRQREQLNRKQQLIERKLAEMGRKPRAI
jgi:hypothetical protein